MQHEMPVDLPSATGSVPVLVDDDAPRMSMIGTLRQRNANYLLEERLSDESGTRSQWTTPRVFRVQVTDETRAVVRANIGRVVSIEGAANHGDPQHRTSIVLTHVELLDS